jgi:hypothetical protein
VQADTSIDLLSAFCEILREAVEIIDGCASTPSSKDVSTDLAGLLDSLVFHESQLESETQREALTAFIDFLSSDVIDFLDTRCLDVHKWQAVRHQLEQAWPELKNIATSRSRIPPREITEDAEASSEELAQNGPGVERATRGASEFLH